MYTICYVLIDNAELEFYKEMIISICSLRKNNYIGKIVTVMDSQTASHIESSSIDRMNQFDVTPLIVDVPDSLSQKEKSRYIKTSLREYIDGTFLFLDTDTVIADELPQVLSEYDIAMVKDTHCKISEMSTKVYQYTVSRNNICGFTLTDDQDYFNSGVMWVKDTEMAHRLFNEWHKNWLVYSKTGMCDDQPGLNHANLSLGNVINKLPDMFNVQVSGNPFPIHHLIDGKIIHFTHNPGSQYLLAKKDIRTLDITDPLIEEIISNPRKAFAEGVALYRSDEHDELRNTKQYFVLYRLYVKYHRLFKIGEFNASIMLGVKSKMKRLFKK